MRRSSRKSAATTVAVYSAWTTIFIQNIMKNTSFIGYYPMVMNFMLVQNLDHLPCSVITLIDKLAMSPLLVTTYHCQPQRYLPVVVLLLKSFSVSGIVLFLLQDDLLLSLKCC